MRKKSAFILAAAVMTAPVVPTAHAGDACSLVQSERMTISFPMPDTLEPVIVGSEVARADAVKKTLCFDFKGSDKGGVVDGENYLRTSITPASLCINVADMKAPPRHITVHYKDGFPDKKSPPMTPERAKEFFDKMIAACRAAHQPQ